MQPEEQRDQRQRYTAIPRVLVFLTHGDTILMLKGAPDKRLWAGKYNGIGGHIETGETPLCAARRELFEETGLCAGQLDLRALIHVAMPEPPGIMLFVYTGNTPSGTLKASEEGMPEWIPIQQLYTLPLVDDLPTLLPRILNNDGVIYARYQFDEAGLNIIFEP